MRNGDAYKIQALHKAGVSDSAIVKRYAWSYSEEQVRRFIPGATQLHEEPKPKPKAKRIAQPKTS